MTRENYSGKLFHTFLKSHESSEKLRVIVSHDKLRKIMEVINFTHALFLVICDLSSPSARWSIPHYLIFIIKWKRVHTLLVYTLPLSAHSSARFSTTPPLQVRAHYLSSPKVTIILKSFMSHEQSQLSHIIVVSPSGYGSCQGIYN